MMRLEIYSDVICPWCYIGKRRLERALALVSAGAQRRDPAGAVGIFWQPFLLNPRMPVDGMDRAAYLAWKFGSAGRADAMAERIVQEGRGAGIDFAFDRIARTPNTTNPHRAIFFAQAAGEPEPFIEALFAGYFTDGRDIGERSELLAIAAKCGLDAERLDGFLGSDAGHAEVSEANARARALGINAVPCFVFDGRQALAGAQPPEVFLRLFDFARREAPATDLEARLGP